ncbi:MAG: T9SS type A sorting domain-containing protein [Chitinophagaceae bacterium]
MKKIFTLCLLAVTSAIMAQSPTIDGVYSTSEGWGAAKGTGTQVGASNGWQGTDAMALYVTYDANYVYFGAQCKAASWMQFIFAVNTQSGGNGTDPWERTITYAQTNLPDYLFRGDIAGTNYAQFQKWNGTSWDRWNGTGYAGADVNANQAGTEVKGTFNANNEGFIELRVPRAAITGTPTVADVQFIITGNNGGTANGHGIFDAIPDANNVTSWTSPGNASTATSYVEGIAISSLTLPINLTAFRGALKSNTIALEWNTTNELNAKGFEIEKLDGNSWRNVGFVAALNNANGSAYTFIDANVAASNVYRIKSVGKSGEYKFSQVIAINGRAATATIQVFPTIVKGNNINIRTTELVEGKANVRVYDFAGRVVTQANLNVAKGDFTQALSLPSLQPGMYFIEVKTATKATTVKVIVD